MNMKIRRLNENDLESLVKLYNQFWDEKSNLAKMKKIFKELKDNPEYIFLCATIDKVVVGSVLGIICEELYGECRPFLIMEDLIVDKNYRNKGIGKALMAKIHSFAKESNCTQIQFITEVEREATILFYESLIYNSKTHVGFKRSIK